MIRMAPPHPNRSMLERTTACVFFAGLAGLASTSTLGCQLVGGLDELRLGAGATGGGAGSGGNGGGGGGDVASSSSSSSSSSSGVPIMGDISCIGEICPVGIESACCYDDGKSNAVCVNAPPATDGCDTAGGASGYETRIECQLPAHCPPGTVCCGNLETIETTTWYPILGCASTCVWPDTVVCDPMGAMPDEVCPIVNDQGMMRQTKCQVSDFLPTGYAVCR